MRIECNPDSCVWILDRSRFQTNIYCTEHLTLDIESKIVFIVVVGMCNRSSESEDSAAILEENRQLLQLLAKYIVEENNPGNVAQN